MLMMKGLQPVGDLQMSFRDIGNKAAVAFVLVCTGAWLFWGVQIFFVGSASFSPGEPGDFVSGSVIFLVIYITFLQLAQMARQDRENAEATVLRAFEVLKPELEGVAAQIVSKLTAASVLSLKDDVDTLKRKFKDDRSVFLRELQKVDVDQAATKFIAERAIVNGPQDTLQKADAALKRYKNLMSALDQNLSELKGNTKVKIADSVVATDIYLAGKVVGEFLDKIDPTKHRVAE